ncbi:ABC transporter substrate-binding protein [Acinetobacter sp.]|uniref:ABC transporter substrate-binding protein n=1 Tax=Acinetobacter sp. TaxID=472 RepID=UPI00264763AE|nr:ABC transporter substrate-binding protein [Acinetobacter sp.]MDN5511723.1 ABC transporter substrate-binding protein [Acinetobacter sp.]MDN5524926.1 ABC transporter substrate-binding protein [Acinetobacter sp.]
MTDLEKTQIQIGYIPLLDCVAILWAKQRGFFAELGLEVTLVKEASWASLRDRLAFGFLDAAHCLSAMLPAAALGEDQLGIPLQTALVLSHNRAFISLSQKLCFDLHISAQDNAQQSAEKIVSAIQAQQSIQLAHVFKQSIHHYCLREWLALANAEVAEKIKLTTLPPPYMVEALSNHVIDGFCVGEPWNTQGELLGISQVVASSQDVIPKVADKVLAVTADWAAQHPHTHRALVAAIEKAQQELQTLEDYTEVWKMLIDFNIVQFQCSDSIHVKKFHSIQSIIRNFVIESSVPKVEDFHWLIQQMLKWDHISLNQHGIDQISQNCILSLQK